MAFSSTPENTGMQRVRITDYRCDLQTSLNLFFKNHHLQTLMQRVLMLENLLQCPSEKVETCCHDVSCAAPGAAAWMCRDTRRHLPPVPTGATLKEVMPSQVKL